MPRSFLGCALLAILAFPVRADQADPPTETLIRLSVPPATAPKPALRYLLLPEFKEMNPGNPCYGYAKCFMEQQGFFLDKQAVERRAALLAMPHKDLPARELLDYGGLALREADWAARLDNPDWQMLLKLKAEGVAALLNDVQPLETLADALKVRLRAEVALGHFDDALRTARTLFAMARHLGEHPTFVANWFGVEIAHKAIGPLEEMLQRPGCPNLYWALAYLPSPLVPLDTAAEGERGLAVSLFRDLDHDAPMTDVQLKTFIAPLDRFLDNSPTVKPGEVAAWIGKKVKDERVVDAARHLLVEHGLDVERLKRFPAEQVILLDEQREYEVRRDEVLKLAQLPAWQGLALATKLRFPPGRALFADPLLEGLLNIPRGPARLDQRLALLRHVEALRLYAADHDGAPPSTLDEIPLPLPVDPFSGKPFRYGLDGGVAHLRGTPPPGEEKDPVFNIHYEVTLKKRAD